MKKRISPIRQDPTNTIKFEPKNKKPLIRVVWRRSESRVPPMEQTNFEEKQAYV